MGRRGTGVEGPDGLLLVDKPAGISSAAVVARVRRVLGGVRAGHTGTLDPFATGLLPLCLGEGTKLAAYLTDEDKGYEGTIRLGVTSDTHDRTGTLSAGGPVPDLDATLLEEVAAEFRGDIRQVPPSFSAIKKGGTPMYELARRGEAPELDARPVRVDRLEFAPSSPAGRISVVIDCSKGFYVRSLARDIGEKLGCGAVLEALRRTRVGSLRVEDAVPLEALEQAGGEALARSRVVSMVEALAGLRRLDVGADQAAGLRLGRQGALVGLPAGEPGERARVACGGDLVAVAICEGRLWALERVFAARRVGASSCPPSGFVLAPAVSQLEEEERNEANRRD
jgi:tRNA pseudouridine55 synthase